MWRLGLGVAAGDEYLSGLEQRRIVFSVADHDEFERQAALARIACALEQDAITLVLADGADESYSKYLGLCRARRQRGRHQRCRRGLHLHIHSLKMPPQPRGRVRGRGDDATRTTQPLLAALPQRRYH